MVKAYFPNKLDYQRFMGYYSSTVGSVFVGFTQAIFYLFMCLLHTYNQPNKTYRATTFIVIFFGSNIVKHLGWRIGALATPGADLCHN